MSDPEVASLVARYRLAVPTNPPRGGAGDLLGRGTGASLEFQDRRAYSVGDDLRHLDWRAYARTDQLLVRLYREEVSPRIELVIDGSKSMASSPEKEELTRRLVALIVGLARAEGYPVAAIRLGASVTPLPSEQAIIGDVRFDGDRPLTDLLPRAREMIRRGSLRICVSDFLFAADAASVVRPLAREAGGLILLQVLSEMDEAPTVGEALRLTDVETGESLDLVLDQHAVDGYLQKLRSLTSSYTEECRRAAAPFLPLSTRTSLGDACATSLVRGGLLTPR